MPYLYKEKSVTTDSVDFNTMGMIQETYFKIKSSVPLDTIGGLSGIFTQLCKMLYEEKSITNFSVTRSTLEQVFIQFAKHQIE